MRSFRGALRAFSPLLPASDGLFVLTYHLVGAGTGGPVDLDLAVFRDQLSELRELARVVDLDEACSELAHGARRETLVVLTFDDAYLNFYTHAWPELVQLDLPAILYVPVAFVDGLISPPIRGTQNLRACDWSQLREMSQSGRLRIGSHTIGHADLRRQPPDRLREEVVGARAMLEDRLGVPVSSFCYPRGHWAPAAEALVRETYSTAVIGGGARTAYRGHCPWRLERVPIRRDMPPSLAPVLSSRVWLEERVASSVRRWR